MSDEFEKHIEKIRENTQKRLENNPNEDLGCCCIYQPSGGQSHKETTAENDCEGDPSAGIYAKWTEYGYWTKSCDDVDCPSD